MADVGLEKAKKSPGARICNKKPWVTSYLSLYLIGNTECICLTHNISAIRNGYPIVLLDLLLDFPTALCFFKVQKWIWVREDRTALEQLNSVWHKVMVPAGVSNDYIVLVMSRWTKKHTASTNLLSLLFWSANPCDEAVRQAISEQWHKRGVFAFIKNILFGAPGWFNQLSVGLWLRTWFHSLGFQVLHQALCWQLGAWSLLRILSVCLCLSLSLPLPHLCSVSLSQK